MKYLGVGHSVGAQNEEKSSSPLIFRRRLCQAPRVCAGERDRSSPAAPSRFSFSVRARPPRGARGGRQVLPLVRRQPRPRRLPHRPARRCPTPSSRCPAPRVGGRGSGLGGQGPAAAGSGFPRPSASPRRRPGCRPWLSRGMLTAGLLTRAGAVRERGAALRS